MDDAKVTIVQRPAAHGSAGVAATTPVADTSEPMLRWFDYSHLPPAIQDYSRPYSELAHWMVNNLPRNAERTVALRKLLECKDAGVRAFIAK